MIICQNCGTKNNDNFNCCYNCGTPLPKDASTQKKDTTEKKPKIIPLSFGDEPEEEIETEAQPEEIEMVDEASAFEQEPEYGAEEYAPADEEYPQEYGEYNEYGTQGEAQEPDYDTAYEEEAQPEPMPLEYTKPPRKPAAKKQNVKRNPKFDIKLSKLIPVLALVLLALLVVWGTGKILDGIFSGNPGTTNTPTPPPATLPPESSFNTQAMVYSQSDDNGNKTFKIDIFTEGEKIIFLMNEYPVVDGAVTVEISELDIYKNYRPNDIQAGQVFDAQVPIVVQKTGYKDYLYNVDVTGVATPRAPFTLLTPSALVTEVYKTNTQISFQTEKNSVVYINGENYTTDKINLLDPETGIFSITVNTAISEDPYRWIIKIETEGYMTREVEFILTRKQSWDPLANPEIKVDNKIYTAGEDCTAKITGTFMGNPNDLVFVDKQSGQNLEIVSLVMSDDGEGKFEATVKLTKLGWSDISVECKTNLDYFDTVLVKCLADSLGGANKFFGSCQDVLDNYGRLQDGGRYVTWANKYAVIKSVEKSEYGYAFYATLNTGSAEQLIYVETCEESFTFEAGRSVVVHANKCGEKDGVPRFIAVRVAAK